MSDSVDKRRGDKQDMKERERVRWVSSENQSCSLNTTSHQELVSGGLSHLTVSRSKLLT